MTQEVDWLKCKSLAFTGRLACLTRTEAAALVHDLGGKFAPTVNQHTSFLVVGQEGWPLQENGQLTIKLRKARRLQRQGFSLVILTEEEFLTRLGLSERVEGIHRLYSTAQLSRLLRVPPGWLRRWIQAGLIQPAETVHGVSYFDFQQVLGAKTLLGLAQAGVSTDRVRRSLRQLRGWFQGADLPLAQLTILEKNGPLLVRGPKGMADTSGQLHFDFAGEPEARVVRVPDDAPTAEEWFAKGCRFEEEENWAEAAEAYRQALAVGGPDAETCYNLANVLHAQGKKDQACERYCQVVEMDPSSAEAWNNLGVVRGELKQFDQALAAFQKAVNLNYADAHFNLADLLEQMGQAQRAQVHWRAFVKKEPLTAWGRYARSRIVS